MTPRKHALGIVVLGRWSLTQKTLQSIYHSDQSMDSYDLFIIDNGSDDATSADLKEWVHGGLVPVKNLVTLKKSMPLGPAWNLFMDMARDYEYRTKLDNDLIFANTPVSEAEDPQSTRGPKRSGDSPNDFGTNPGAPRVASFQIGAGKHMKKQSMKTHTCFLDHLTDAMKQKTLGIASLVPVPPKQTLAATMPTMGNITWRDTPCLVGGCMTVSKACFNQLGFFDEKLPRHIDFEYSQRAMGAGINVGYVDNYCVVDLGKSFDALSPEKVQKNEWEAKRMSASISFTRGFVHSKWEAVHNKIGKSASKNTIVNLSNG